MISAYISTGLRKFPRGSRFGQTPAGKDMKYSVRLSMQAHFGFPGPRSTGWRDGTQREEMNMIIYLVRGGGKNILINTGPPQDLSILNQAWPKFFGFPEAQIVRAEEQLAAKHSSQPWTNAGRHLEVIVTPLQLYATANIHLFGARDLHLAQRLDRGLSGSLLSPARAASLAHFARGEQLPSERRLGTLRLVGRGRRNSARHARVLGGRPSPFIACSLH